MPSEITTLESHNGIQWIDIFNPKKSDIELIAQKYGLISTSIQDLLDPEHLPKFENLKSYSFLMLRAYDEKSGPEFDTLRELTRKVAILYNEKFIITVHRKDQAILAELRNKWRERMTCEPDVSVPWILTDIVKTILLSYEIPIDAGLEEFEQYELSTIDAHGSKPFSLRNGYLLKRRAFVFKRILRLTHDSLQKMTNIGSFDYTKTTYYQDLKETTDNLYFYADDLVESTTSLLNFFISLQQKKTSEASHRANEVMRVLTIFSVFFMPLNFLASLYGMNYTNMPGLDKPYGFFLMIAFMLAMTFTTYLWFRRKGWI
jgi:magnesium transporter